MAKPEVLIYGASGYTGKMIAWHLAEYGIPFTAAGRNQARLEEQMAKVAELQGAAYDCIEVAHETTALAQAFAGYKIVYNVVGPFGELAEPVVQACLEAGCHYLDTTGEPDWMMHIRNTYGERYAAKNLLLCPSTSWMWVGGQLAAELALETEGIDTLDICYTADSNTSVASTASFLRMLTKPQLFLAHDQLSTWPPAMYYPVSLPGEHRVFNAFPWSGGAEPVWYENDDRVRNCSVLVAFKNQELFDGLLGIMKDFEANYKDKSEQEQTAHTRAVARAIVNTEPNREIPNENRSVVSCYARGNVKSINVILRGSCPYIQTGAFAAEAVSRILSGRSRGTGFVSPCGAFGARNMLAAIANRGLLTWEATSD